MIAHASSYVLLFIIIAAKVLTVAALAKEAGEQPPYLDYSLPVETRAADLLSRLSLEEKASLLVNKSAAVPRLGIVKYNFWNEALHGVKSPGKFTVFPQAIAFGASWDPGLIKEIATAISDEARGKDNELAKNGVAPERGLRDFFAPTINMARDPRWGRTPETYGEDPFLTSSIAVAYIKGLQGDDPRYIKVIATAKHFAANNEEHNRFYANAIISEKTIREYYFPAFKAAVEEGGVKSVMGAYNAINGVPCNANKWMLTDVLRGEWGFDGYIVTDCDALFEMTFGHKYTKSGAEASAAALNAGVDLECANAEMMKKGAVEALATGLTTQKEIDRAVLNVLTARFRAGMFDPPELDPYTKISPSVIGSPEHQALALRAAQESIVLLKNEQIGGKHLLPLDINKIKSIAVAGPVADVLRFGDYSGTPVNEAVTTFGGVTNRAGGKIKVSLIKYVQPSGEYTTVPAENLEQPGVSAARGLKSEYFSNAGFNGDPQTSRAGETVNIGEGGADNSAPRGPASFRWTGKLTPPTTGEYSLALHSNGSARILLDGKQILFRNEEQKHKPKTGEPAGLKEFAHKDRDKRAAANVTLDAGRQYEIVIEYAITKGVPAARFEWAPPRQDIFTAGDAETIRNSDAVIAVMGIGRDEEQEGSDRETLDLPLGQTDYVRQLYKANRNTIVVLINGGPLSVNWIQQNIPAIIEAWYPGEQGGNAVADALFGNINPSGKLPVTFYKSVYDLPSFEDYEISNGRTYMYFDKPSLFPFGHGLSYTSFNYSSLATDISAASPAYTITASFDIANTGKMDGAEAAQLYVRDLSIRDKAPIMRLKGFKKIFLKKGEAQKVHINLPVNDLAYWDETAKQFKVEPGEYEILIGSSSKDIRLKSVITVKQ